MHEDIAKNNKATSPRERPRFGWFVASLIALTIHVVLAFLTALFLPVARDVPRTAKPMRVDLFREKKSHNRAPPRAPPKREVHEREQLASTKQSRRPKRLTEKTNPATAIAPLPAEHEASDSLEPMDTDTNVPKPLSLEKLRKIDLTPDFRDLNKIATQDARVKRKLYRPKPGPWAIVPKPSKFNVPARSPHVKIEQLIEDMWKPDWTHLKDDSIRKVSPAWFKQGVKEWFKSWENQLNDDRAHRDPGVGITARFNDDASSSVNLELDIEPLKDGTWAVSIAKPSGHPFFDQHALGEVRKIASLFPTWKEGYGNALRFRLNAKFIIIPPNVATMLGLSCAFPFCTPEEYKELEVYYWFKKLIRKYVYFEGVMKPPDIQEQPQEVDAGLSAEEKNLRYRIF